MALFSLIVAVNAYLVLSLVLQTIDNCQVINFL